MDVLDIVTIIVSIINIVISILINMIKRPLLFDVENIEIDNIFDMLFVTNGKNKSEVTVWCANYNNQDILLYLQNGYISVKNKEKNRCELHAVERQYFTLKANSFSDIKIKVNVASMEVSTTDSEARDNKICNNETRLIFKYYDGIQMKTFEYKKNKCMNRS